MKKYISIFIALGVSFASCDKKLDLLPQQSVAEEVALSSDANVKKVLNGAYDALSSGDLYGGSLFLYSELLAAGGLYSDLYRTQFADRTADPDDVDDGDLVTMSDSAS